jgi:hypothetical protein
MSAAQYVPAISTRYSDEVVAGMIRRHKNAHSRDVNPPSLLASKFKADFPKAHGVEWELADSVYNVEFKLRFRDCEAYYDFEGNLLMLVEEITRSELPAVVKNAAEAKYPKFGFEDIDRIRRGTEVFYKIEMEHRDTDVKLLIKSDGTVSEH